MLRQRALPDSPARLLDLVSKVVTRGIPVVAFTASEPASEDLQDAGFCALVTKPVSPPEMVEAIGICLEAYEQGDRWIPDLMQIARKGAGGAESRKN